MYKLESKTLQGDDRYEGFAVDLIHHLSLELGFNYTYIVEEDKYYGEKLKDGSGEWDGMIGRIMKEVITDSRPTHENARHET